MHRCKLGPVAGSLNIVKKVIDRILFSPVTPYLKVEMRPTYKT